jgi:hypothetical protein
MLAFLQFQEFPFLRGSQRNVSSEAKLIALFAGHTQPILLSQ